MSTPSITSPSTCPDCGSTSYWHEWTDTPKVVQTHCCQSLYKVPPDGPLQKIVQHLETALNQVVLCTDGEQRRLVEIQEHLLHYEVELNGGYWMRLSGTRRWEAEPRFIGGTFVTPATSPDAPHP